MPRVHRDTSIVGNANINQFKKEVLKVFPSLSFVPLGKHKFISTDEVDIVGRCLRFKADIFTYCCTLKTIQLHTPDDRPDDTYYVNPNMYTLHKQLRMYREIDLMRVSK